MQAQHGCLSRSERGDLHVLVEAVEAEVVPAAEEADGVERDVVGADPACHRAGPAGSLPGLSLLYPHTSGV